MTSTEARQFIAQFDVNEDGVLSIEEFVQAFTGSKIGTTPYNSMEAARAAIEAEAARVKALTEAERTALGKKYTEPEELWRALEAGGGGATLVLRGSWLKKQRVESGFRLPKRGEALPPEATITPAELRTVAEKAECVRARRDLAVALLADQGAPRPGWRDGRARDRGAAAAVEGVRGKGRDGRRHPHRLVRPLGKRRSAEQELTFKAGLKAINQWYAHQGTTVLLITAGADRAKGLTYWDKGWTSFEFALAMLIKPANTSGLKDWAQVVDLGKQGDAQIEFGRPELSEPLAFFGGHEYGSKTYTNGADRDNIVAPKSARPCLR